MTKVHCILVTPIKIKEKQKKIVFFRIFTAHNAKLKYMYYIEQLKGTYKKPPLHLLLLWKDKWIHALPSLTLFCYFTLSKNFKHSSLLPISEFVLDEKFLPAKHFKICNILYTRKSKVAFPLFISCYFILIPCKCKCNLF